MLPKKIALLTDSCADIAPCDLKENIFTVPLRILCADGEYRDGEDITPADIYRRLHSGEMPKTSLPSGEDIGNAIERIVAGGYDGVIAVMLSSGLSGTFNMARLIGEECEGRLEVRVFDSLSASLGQGMMVLQLAKDIEAGMGWEELVEQRVPQLVANTHAFFSVETLEFLEKGGRIGKASAAAGTLLQIKPVLGFSAEGKLQAVAKVRGRNLVMDKLVAMTVKHCGEHKRYNLAIANGGCPEDMEKVRAKLLAALPECENIWAGEIDCTLSSYIGDGILGAAVQILD